MARGGELDGETTGEGGGDEPGKSNEVSLVALECIGRQRVEDWKISGSMCIRPGSCTRPGSVLGEYSLEEATEEES